MLCPYFAPDGKTVFPAAEAPIEQDDSDLSPVSTAASASARVSASSTRYPLGLQIRTANHAHPVVIVDNQDAWAGPIQATEFTVRRTGRGWPSACPAP